MVGRVRRIETNEEETTLETKISANEKTAYPDLHRGATSLN